MSRGNGAAWASVGIGLASVATLPVAIFVTRFSNAYELLHAGFAVPLGLVLGVASIALARRAARRSAVRLRGTRPARLPRLGRALGLMGICLAAAGVVALGVYGLLEYAGTRE